MSAFTNWNGPGDCCGGGIDAIPQINALNDLLAKYTAVELQIQALANQLTQHAAQPSGVSATGTPHTAIQAAIVSVQNALTKMGDPASGYGTLAAWITAVSSAASAAQTTATNAGNAAATAQSTATGAQTTANTAQNNATAALTRIGTVKTGYASISAWLTAVENAVNDIAVTWDTTDDEVVLKKKLRALDVLCQNIKMWWQIDFDNWKSSASILVASNTSTMPYIICELLELSQVDSTTQRTSGYARKKPGRAYVRSVDTEAWSAIIDAVCASSDNDGTITGALTVVATKTQSRGPTAALGKMKFGIYRGTTTDGVKHIYLGVVHDPAIPITAPTMHFCGHNVAYVGAAPNNGVTTLAETAWIDGSGGSAFSEIHVEKIYSDNYLDARGNGVAVTDPNKTLTFGNEKHETIIISKNRPPVDDDEGTHQIAYLSDLHNSIVWQRAVTAFCPNLATLNAAKVWVTTDADGNAVVVRDGTTGATQVPGIYLTPHSATETGPVAGYIFQPDDVALLKQGQPPVSTGLADGKINATISTGITTDADKLIGFPDTTQIKVGYTTVVDNVGNYGRITAFSAGGSVTIAPIAAASLPKYVQPAYAKFNGTTWVTTPADNIAIPVATDNYVAALTYEWSGHHISVLHATDGYYTPSYILWTPHYQQATSTGSMNYVDVEEWSFIDITLAGVRDAAQQDIIDRAIIALAQEQPDWANYQSTRLTQIPGQGKSIQPDPSFIHNKPWAGLGVISGGGFNQPAYQGGWIVDGGDFTGMGGKVRNPAAAPPISPDDTYRNVLIQVLHGKYEDMPEVKMLTDGSTTDTQNRIRSNYAWSLRICSGSSNAANDGLYYSNGQAVYKLVGTAI